MSLREFPFRYVGWGMPTSRIWWAEPTLHLWRRFFSKMVGTWVIRGSFEQCAEGR